MSKLIKKFFSKAALLNIKNRFVGVEVHKNPFGESITLRDDKN